MSDKLFKNDLTPYTCQNDWNFVYLSTLGASHSQDETLGISIFKKGLSLERWNTGIT